MMHTCQNSRQERFTASHFDKTKRCRQTPMFGGYSRPLLCTRAPKPFFISFFKITKYCEYYSVAQK